MSRVPAYFGRGRARGQLQLQPSQVDAGQLRLLYHVGQRLEVLPYQLSGWHTFEKYAGKWWTPLTWILYTWSTNTRDRSQTTDTGTSLSAGDSCLSNSGSLWDFTEWRGFRITLENRSDFFQFSSYIIQFDQGQTCRRFCEPRQTRRQVRASLSSQAGAGQLQTEGQ